MTHPLHLAPPDPTWAATFEHESHMLREVFGDALVAVAHIGSTAVPGLSAKPIVDVMPIVRSLEAFDLHRHRAEKAGFEWHGEHGIPGRRYLVRRGPDEDVTHVHAFSLGDPQVLRHLAFRDLLRVNPRERDAYAELKHRLSHLHTHDRAAYTHGKAVFIDAAIARFTRELFHLTPTPAPIAPTPEGFVHLSTRAQVLGTAARFFRGRTDLLLLQVDPHGLDLRWEWNDGDLFPHLYGTISQANVVHTWPLVPHADGTFAFPG